MMERRDRARPYRPPPHAGVTRQWHHHLLAICACWSCIALANVSSASHDSSRDISLWYGLNMRSAHGIARLMVSLDSCETSLLLLGMRSE